MTAKKKLGTCRKPGRIGVYDAARTPSILFCLAAAGKTNHDMANLLKISDQTLSEWTSKYPAIAEALKDGRSGVDKEVENALLKSALGYDASTETVRGRMVNGKLVPKDAEKKKHMVPPNVTAQIFWLKNRMRQKWADVHNHVIDQHNVTLVVPDNKRKRKDKK